MSDIHFFLVWQLIPHIIYNPLSSGKKTVLYLIEKSPFGESFLRCLSVSLSLCRWCLSVSLSVQIRILLLDRLIPFSIIRWAAIVYFYLF